MGLHTRVTSRIASRTGLVAGAMIVALVAAEAGLRLANYRYNPVRIAAPSDDDWRFHHSFQDDDFLFDPYLIWRPKPSVDVFNEQGYRGRPLPTVKSPDSYRILTIGDSNTLGWGNNGPNWPQYLEELLARDDDRVSVVNGGVWGYSSFQGLRRFKASLVLQPDMVLVSFGSNDALRVTITDAQYAGRVTMNRALGRSRLGQLWLQAWDRVALRPGGTLVPRVPIGDYEANLREFARIGAANHVTVVLLTRPFSGDIAIGSWKEQAQECNRGTVEVATAAGLPYVNVDDLFGGRPEYFADESHFNEQGHRRAATLIYDRIRPLIPRREHRGTAGRP